MKFIKQIFILAATAALASCNGIPKDGIAILPEKDGSFSLYIDGRKTYINGVGGANKLDVAKESGANSFRTWGGNIESIKKYSALAAENGLYIMQGIGLSKKHDDYLNEEYKDKLRNEVRELASTFKDDKNIIIWGLGNEIELFGSNGEAEWTFVNELSEIIKSIDKRHLTATVIAHDPAALDSLAKYAPSLDLVGINSYGYIETIPGIVEKSAYKGAYLITEWGPTGWWECERTEWGAPIEQTSEEKRTVYEDRYAKGIKAGPRCLGSYCFLWGQKEERTPTWFCMFVEHDVEGLPLDAEKTPMVEGMQRVWTGEEPQQTAPVVAGMTINGLAARQSPVVSAGKAFKAAVDAADKEETRLKYVWENLAEATITAQGGAWEPRPDRIGDVVTTDAPELELKVKEPGNYRLYCYILDGTGFCATINVPYQVK